MKKLIIIPTLALLAFLGWSTQTKPSPAMSAPLIGSLTQLRIGQQVMWTTSLIPSDSFVVNLGSSTKPVNNYFGKSASLSLNLEAVGYASASQYFGAGLLGCTGNTAIQWFKGLFQCSGLFESQSTLLDNLSALGGNGFIVQNSATTVVNRTIQGTTNQITVTNGDGVVAAPTLSIPTIFSITNASLSANFEAAGYASLSDTFISNPTAGASMILSVEDRVNFPSFTITKDNKVGIRTFSPKSPFEINDAVYMGFDTAASTSFGIRSLRSIGSVASISATSLTTGNVFNIRVPATSWTGNIFSIRDINNALIASISGVGNLELAGYASISKTVSSGGGSAGHATCWKADGRTIGYCSTVVDASGLCTCN